MDDLTKKRICELMFHVVPDPDEKLTSDALARSETVDPIQKENFKAEFRLLIESMTAHPEVRQTVLDALDDLEVTGWDNDAEQHLVREIMSRWIRRILTKVLQPFDQDFNQGNLQTDLETLLRAVT